MQPFAGYEGIELLGFVQIDSLLTNGLSLFNKSNGIMRDRHVGRFVLFLDEKNQRQLMVNESELIII